MERPHDIDGVQIIAEISRSASSVVVKGYQRELERFVLVKGLANLDNDPGFAERFRREAVILARLSDPRIPAVFAYGSGATRAHLIAEYVDGIDLGRLLSHGPLPAPLALYVIRECAIALKVAHADGIVHGDVKPDNVMLAHSGRVMLTDFGLASFERDSSSPIAGTPAYLSPEQILGNGASPASDIFSLGASLYMALSGEQAFGGESTSAILDSVSTHNPLPRLEFSTTLPDDVLDLVRATLAKRTEDRIPSAVEVIARIEEVNLRNGWRVSAQDLESYLADPEQWRTNWAVAHEAVGADPFVEHPPDEALMADTTASNLAGEGRGGLYLLLLVPVLVAVVWISLRSTVPATDPVASGTPGASGETPRVDSATVEIVQVDGQDTTGVEMVTAVGDGAPVTRKPADKVDERVALSLDASPADSTETTPNGRDENTAFVTLGSLNLDVVPWGSVTVGDSLIGQTPLSSPIVLAAGIHRVTVSNPSLPSAVIDVEVRADSTTHAAVSLWDAFTRLHFVVVPWARVHVDGLYRYTTPEPAPLLLPAGVHEIMLEHPELGRRVVEYTARGGAIDTLMVNMTKADSGNS